MRRLPHHIARGCRAINLAPQPLPISHPPIHSSRFSRKTEGATILNPTKMHPLMGTCLRHVMGEKQLVHNNINANNIRASSFRPLVGTCLRHVMGVERHKHSQSQHINSPLWIRTHYMPKACPYRTDGYPALLPYCNPAV